MKLVLIAHVTSSSVISTACKLTLQSLLVIQFTTELVIAMLQFMPVASFGLSEGATSQRMP